MLNLPAILWRLENYFNLFDAHKLLTKMSGGVPINFDLLFESLCTLLSNTNLSYEALECLGDRVLKFLTVLHGTFTMTNADQGELSIWEMNIVSNANLDQASIALNLPSYGIFTQFAFELWNPPYFKLRTEKQSLFKNIRISLKLPADIVEST